MSTSPFKFINIDNYTPTTPWAPPTAYCDIFHVPEILPFPSLEELNDELEISTFYGTPQSSEPIPIAYNLPASSSFDSFIPSLISSKDKLCFIAYTHTNIYAPNSRKEWCLVSVDLSLT